MSATSDHIQPGYTTITPYLYAKPDLADFLKNAFGAEVTHAPTPDAKGQFHAEAIVGERTFCSATAFFPTPRWRPRSTSMFPTSMRPTNVR